MFTFIARLWIYFGLIGVLSVLLWLGAAGTAAAAFLKYPDRRTKLIWIAVGLAVLGFYSGKLNSRFVSRIRIDRSAQEEAFREAQRQEALRQEREARREIMFAEESVGDVETVKDEREADEDNGDEDEDEPAGIEEATTGTGEAGAAEDEDAPRQGQPLYKLRGKREREGGKTETLTEVRQAVKETQKETTSSGKMLEEPDKLRADAWDRANLFLTRWTLVIVLLLAIWDYVRRFNRTFDAFLPLPLACSWMDRLSPKFMTVLLTQVSRDVLAHHLRDFVRRGETYIYFGPQDPVAEPLLTRVGPTDVSLNARVRRFVSWLYDVPKMHVHGLPDPDSGARPQALTRFKNRCVELVAKRWPDLAEHVDLFLFNAGRLGKHMLRRLPVALAVLVILLIPFLIFFTRSSYYLPHYVLTMCLVPWPVLLWNFPGFQPVLPKVRNVPDLSPRDRDFFFETAWFGRCCAVIDDEREAAKLLEDLRKYLKARRVPNARCPQTVNVVWDFGRLPETLDRHAFFDLCRSANFRVIHVSQRVPAEADTLYDEICEG